MSFALLRRGFGLVLLVLAFAVTARAQSFTGPTYIDFDAGGYSNYDLFFYADVVVGGSAYATAYAGYGSSLYETSATNWGEAGVAMNLTGIHKSGGQWIASTLTISIFSDALGAWETFYYYNVPIDSAGYVVGEASCGHTQTVRGTLSGY